MKQEAIEPAAAGNSEIVNSAYDELLLKAFDILEREDFYGVAAQHGIGAFTHRMLLGPDSHLLDIGAGIGGPARHLAKRYGCRITGIDLSAFNCRVAVERTRAAGLDGLLHFVHGDAMEAPLADAAFTHVFGCETLCYFPDKSLVYRLAHRVLKPGGMLAFLEAACDTPLRLRTEDHIGPVRYESTARYLQMLEEAGFCGTQSFDTTDPAIQDVSASLCRLLARKTEVTAAAGDDVYYGLLEIWAEFLAHFTKGSLKHFGFIARKT